MRIIGHRGAAGLAPENTVESIKAALKHGAHEIEIDVRVNSKGEVVLSHDETIKRSALPLESAIKTVNKKCPLIIEVKPYESVAPIVDVIDKFIDKGWRSRDFKVASFDYEILKYVRKHLPEVEVMVLDAWSGTRARKRAETLGTKLIGMNQRWLRRATIKAMKKRGFKLIAYTVNDPGLADALGELGLHAIFTDYPDRFTKG